MNDVVLSERQPRELALFAGAGGGILGGHLLGWRTVCAVEFASYPREVLLARQRDGMLQRFPIWDDVRTFDGKPWRGSVDVVSGGFPCQDISVAGKGDGLDGERSGLWSEMARIIGEVQPRFAFVENSPMLTSRGLDRVLGDLSTMGFDAEWGVVGADDAGAPHRRERIWILAYTNGFEHRPEARPADNGAEGSLGSGHEHGEPCRNGEVLEGAARMEGQHPIGQLANADVCGCLHGQTEERSTERGINALGEPQPSGQDVADAGADRRRLFGNENGDMQSTHRKEAGDTSNGSSGSQWWSTEPGLGRVANGVARRVDRLKAIGNGQVPAAAAIAWRVLFSRMVQRIQ